MIYLFIFITSLVLNYGVQLSYYLWRIRKDPQVFRGQKTLLHYYTGWFGDGIIVPLINILIYYIMVRLGGKEGVEGIEGIGELIKRQPMAAIFGLALVLDVVTHDVQGKLKMTNWSMPKPFRWTFPGYWHMVSLPIQVSYLLLFFWIVVQNGRSILVDNQLALAVAGVFSLMALFLFLFRMDNPPLDTKD